MLFYLKFVEGIWLWGHFIQYYKWLDNNYSIHFASLNEFPPTISFLISIKYFYSRVLVTMGSVEKLLRDVWRWISNSNSIMYCWSLQRKEVSDTVMQHKQLSRWLRCPLSLNLNCWSLPMFLISLGMSLTRISDFWSIGLWCIKKTNESTLNRDSFNAPWTEWLADHPKVTHPCLWKHDSSSYHSIDESVFHV